MVEWETLQALLDYAKDLDAQDIKSEVDAIYANRLLIEEPNRLESLTDQVAQILRKALNFNYERYSATYQFLMAELEKDTAWQKLSDAQRGAILETLKIASVPAIATGTVDEIMESLDAISLKTLYFRYESLPGLFEQARLKAVQLTEPKAKGVALPRRTLQTENDARRWLTDVEAILLEKIKEGPVVV
jgi:hypothetical protein